MDIETLIERLEEIKNEHGNIGTIEVRPVYLDYTGDMVTEIRVEDDLILTSLKKVILGIE